MRRAAAGLLWVASCALPARAFMKSRSPSCDASSGVAAAALRETGVVIEGVD